MHVYIRACVLASVHVWVYGCMIMFVSLYYPQLMLIGGYIVLIPM